jgi:hypothetical protein
MLLLILPLIIERISVCLLLDFHDWLDIPNERFNNLKKANPSVKTSIAVGGWNLGSAPFTRMVATAASRQEFATSTVKFLRDHNFDGLDLDWEYPANRGSPAGDKQKFALLLEVVSDVANSCLLAAVATMRVNGAEPKFQPPTAMLVFTLGLAFFKLLNLSYLNMIQACYK